MMRRRVVLAALSFLLVADVAFAASPAPDARRAYVIEAETGAVLHARAEDEAFAPASLAKLMTMEVVFHALAAGTLSLDQSFVVSEHAWRTGGAPSRTSTMFAAVKSRIRVEDLIRGVIVQAANDGCIVLAEGIAGSEEAFAAMMNARAQELGLDGTRFVNATGLPAEGQRTTARDMAKLALHIWREHPDRYGIYAEPDFTWNRIRQSNRNPLLKMEIGADGLALGFSEASGFAIAAAAQQGERRVFAVLNGFASDADRATQTRAALEWSLRDLEKVTLFEPGAIVGEAELFGGERPVVKLAAGDAVVAFIEREERGSLSARVVYDGPIRAPVEQGAAVATLEVRLGDTLMQAQPLFSAEQVGQGGFHQRAFEALKEMALGWMR